MRTKNLFIGSAILSILITLYSLLSPSRSLFIVNEPVNGGFSYYVFNDGYNENQHYHLNGGDWLQTQKILVEGQSIPLSRKNRVRIDYDSTRSKGVINQIYLVEKNFVYRKVSKLLTENHKFPSNKVEANGPGLIFDTNTDAWIDLDATHVNIEVLTSHWSPLAFYLFLLLIALAFAGYGWFQIFKSTSAVFHLSTLILVSTLLIINIRTFQNIGPDEPMHVGSASWYSFFDRPPSPMDNPQYTNHAWQTSYLFGQPSDISYLVTAKTKEILECFKLFGGHFSLRLSQLLAVLVFLGLIAHFISPTYSIGFLLLMMIIPQLSFINTYYNGDIFYVLMGFTGLIMIYDKTFLKESSFAKSFLCGLMILSAKMTMIPLGLACTYYHFRNYNFKLNKKFWLHSSLLILCLPLFAWRRMINIYYSITENTSYRQVRLERFQALPDDLPFDVLTGKLAFLKANGVYEPNIHLLTDINWYFSSFRSFFGTFGLMNVNLPLWMIYISFCILVLICFKTFKKGLKIEILLLALTILLALAASMHFSVFNGSQPQGRYLFSIVALLGVIGHQELYKNLTYYSYFILLMTSSFWYFVASPFFISLVAKV